MLTRAEGRRGGELFHSCYRVYIWGAEKDPEIDSSDVAQHCECN